MPQVSVDTYRAIFDRSPNAILIANDAAQLIDVNPAAAEFTGYSRDELLRMCVFDLTLDELRYDTNRLWRDFLARGMQSGPFDLQRKDGSRHRVQYEARAHVTAGAHLSMLRNLTLEEASYGELKVSEELLDAVFEHSPISLQVFAPDGRILRANAAWERLWNVDRTALAGYNVLHDAQLARRGLLERVRAAFAGETIVIPSVRYDPRESDHPGRVRWLSATFVPVRDVRRSVTEVVLALEDLTERRKADMRASTQHAVSRILAESAGIVEAAPALVRAIGSTLDWTYGALWLHDRNEGALRCVHAWTASAGSAGFVRGMCMALPPGEGLPGCVFHSREPRWIPDLGAGGEVPRLASARAAGFRAAVGIPIMIDTRTLGALEFFSGEPAPADTQLIDTLSGIGHQIGQYIERRSAERAEAAAAQAANHLKDEFLAVLSHELRTPLNAILGWTRLLRGGELDPVARGRAMEIIERNAYAQAQIVEDLLDVSRIITGKLRLDVQPVDLARVAGDVLESMRPAAEARRIELVTEFEDVGIVSADPHRMQQVTWNLLSNAIRFTPPGGRVVLSIQRGTGGLELRVTDTGAGIAPELLPRVFDRFLQGDSSTTRKHGGLGLGLAIVRHLAELHGGSASADSPGPGRGATFRVWLPLSAATDTPR